MKIDKQSMREIITEVDKDEVLLKNLSPEELKVWEAARVAFDTSSDKSFGVKDIDVDYWNIMVCKLMGMGAVRFAGGIEEKEPEALTQKNLSTQFKVEVTKILNEVLKKYKNTESITNGLNSTLCAIFDEVTEIKEFEREVTRMMDKELIDLSFLKQEISNQIKSTPKDNIDEMNTLQSELQSVEVELKNVIIREKCCQEVINLARRNKDLPFFINKN